ncbi:MAG: thioesterase family protein [Bdellovibrionota bacterium]
MSTPHDQSRWFTYRSRVAFYDTDAMGVVHHANYIRYFEDARLEWMREAGLLYLHHPYGPFVFAVYDLRNQYWKPLKFDEEFEIRLQTKLEGARVHFQYALWSPSQKTIAAAGSIALVPVDVQLKPSRLPKEAREVFARTPWDEVWPPAPGTLTP